MFIQVNYHKDYHNHVFYARDSKLQSNYHNFLFYLHNFKIDNELS